MLHAHWFTAISYVHSQTLYLCMQAIAQVIQVDLKFGSFVFRFTYLDKYNFILMI